VENLSQTDDRVMTLLELALTRPEDEHEAYLRSACGSDSGMFDKVWSYIQWEKRMKGFMLDPLHPQAEVVRPFELGQQLINRFRIVREVAQGGMGIVWEAVDEKLDRRVALKCAKAGFGKQLPPEVRNAREISHPNVCKIFEIHTATTPRGDVDFISMEFLEGETLADRMRRVPLSKLEARSIARQLCAGLAEAHRNNVIHGDLKSNNVILATGPSGSLRAVITDFGLARTPGASGRTTSAPLAGTPAYMAPELWKGEKASIASDIYALGVMLWELKTGRKASELEVTSATLSWDERLAWKPPSGHGKWDRTIARCLDPNPARRFPTAEHVARALGPSRAKQWLLAVAAAIILIASTGLAVHQLTLAPREVVRLAVLPFTAPADAAPLADKIWRDSMGQISLLKGNARTKFTLAATAERRGRKVSTTDQAVQELKASHVLRGTLTQDHEATILHAYLSDARSGVTTKEWNAEYASGETRFAGAALASFLAETLRLPPLVAHPTVNVKARQDYARGLANLRRDTGVDAALIAMQKAVTEDSDSALTHAGLAEAQWRKYYLTNETVLLEQAKKSARRAERRNPDLAEVHRISGLLEANAGRYEQALGEYQRAIALDPRNCDTYRRLGEAYESNDQLSEALVAFQRAIELQPDYYRAHQDLGAFYFQRGAYGDAINEFRRAVVLAPAEPNAHFAFANAYLNLGRYTEAEGELRLAIQLRETSISLQTLGLVLMYERREREAIPFLSRACVLNPHRYVAWMHLGTCYRRTNHPTEAARAYQSGLEAAEREVVKNPRSGYARSFLSYLCANTGDRHGAESEVLQALQLSPDDAGTQFMAALTYEALGRRGEALGVLSTASNEVVADLSRWPDVADLHRDTRFIERLTSR
jgi:eukaryotic-like serine/threonine-protein kinase